MIAELIREAKARDLDHGLYFVRVPVKILDMTTSTITDGTAPVYKRPRSGIATNKIACPFVEQAGRLQVGHECRSAFVAMLKTMNVLPTVVQFLEQGGIVPMEEGGEALWTTFLVGGQVPSEIPALRQIASEYLTREDQDFLPDHGPCSQCNVHGPLVALHRNGLSEISPAAPVLVTASRKSWGRRGTTTPMCLRCMRLYTNMINVLARDHGQRTSEGTILPVGANGVVISADNSSAYVVSIITGIGDDLRKGKLYAQIQLEHGDVNLMLHALRYKDKIMIETMTTELPSPIRSCPGTACGELFAYLERALDGALDMHAALANPRVFITRTFPAARQALAQDDGALPFWFKQLISSAVEGLNEFPTVLTEEQKARFVLAYCKTSTRRFRAGAGKTGPTPYALRLGDALRERGIEVRYEVNVWSSLTEPQPDHVPEDGWIAKGWYRIDLVMAGTKIAIEVDGGGRDYDADREREYVLSEKGWTVRRVTNGNLSTDEGIALWADRFARMAASSAVVAA